METLEQDEEPAPPEQEQLSKAAPPSEVPQVKKSFWSALKSRLEAFCAPRPPDYPQNHKKTSQEWRDEWRAKNPWWGHGL